MAITYLINIMYIFINLDGNKINAINIKQLISM